MDAIHISSKHRVVRAKEIRWDEIEEIHDGENNLLFRGHRRQLFISGPKSWSGSDKEQMQRWLNLQLEKHSAKTEKARFISFKRSKNTRVRK